MLAIPALYSQTAVSYTHLDVYKRQLPSPVREQAAGGAHSGEYAGTGGARGMGEGTERSAAGERGKLNNRGDG